MSFLMPSYPSINQTSIYSFIDNSVMAIPCQKGEKCFDALTKQFKIIAISIFISPILGAIRIIHNLGELLLRLILGYCTSNQAQRLKNTGAIVNNMYCLTKGILHLIPVFGLYLQHSISFTKVERGEREKNGSSPPPPAQVDSKSGGAKSKQQPENPLQLLQNQLIKISNNFREDKRTFSIVEAVLYTLLQKQYTYSSRSVRAPILDQENLNLDSILTILALENDGDIDKVGKFLFGIRNLDNRDIWEYFKTSGNLLCLEELAKSTKHLSAAVKNETDSLQSATLSDENRERIYAKLGKIIYLDVIISKFQLREDQIKILNKILKPLCQDKEWKNSNIISKLLLALSDESMLQLMSRLKFNYYVPQFICIVSLFSKGQEEEIKSLAQNIQKIKRGLKDRDTGLAKQLKGFLCELTYPRVEIDLDVRQTLLKTIFEEDNETTKRRLRHLYTLTEMNLLYETIKGKSKDTISDVFSTQIEDKLMGKAGVDLSKIENWHQKFETTFLSDNQLKSIFGSFKASIHKNCNLRVIRDHVMSLWQWMVSNILEGSFKEARKNCEAPTSNNQSSKKALHQQWVEIDTFEKTIGEYTYSLSEEWQDLILFNFGNCWCLTGSETRLVWKNLRTIADPRYRIVLIKNSCGNLVGKTYIYLNDRNIEKPKLDLNTYHSKYTDRSKTLPSDTKKFCEAYAEKMMLPLDEFSMTEDM